MRNDGTQDQTLVFWIICKDTIYLLLKKFLKDYSEVMHYALFKLIWNAEGYILLLNCIA